MLATCNSCSQLSLKTALFFCVTCLLILMRTFFILCCLFVRILAYAQDSTIVSVISGVYGSSGNNEVVVKKIISDSLGAMYVYLKAKGAFYINEKRIHDLPNNKSNLPSYRIVRLSSNGDEQWNIASFNPFADIACDKEGNLYFCANDITESKNSKIVFFQSKSIIVCEGTNNVLVKYSSDGNYQWSKKLQGNYYLPRSVLYLSENGKLFYLVTKNGSRNMDHVLTCISKDGFDEWRCDIPNRMIDVFAVNSIGESYVGGVAFKTMENGIIDFPYKADKFFMNVISEEGNIKPLYEKKFSIGDDGRKDYFVNQILFDSLGQPQFYFADLLLNEGIQVCEKKIKKEKGELFIVETDKKGNVIWEFQLKCGGIEKQRDKNQNSIGLYSSVPILNISENKLIAQTTATIAFKYGQKKFEPLSKTDVLSIIINKKDNGSIDQIKNFNARKYAQSSNNFSKLNDSSYLFCTGSDFPIQKAQGNYWKISKQHLPKVKKKRQSTLTENSTKTPIDFESVLIDSAQIDSAIAKHDEINTENIAINSTKTTFIANTDTSTQAESFEFDTSQIAIEPTFENSNANQENESDNHAMRAELLPMPNGQTLVLDIYKIPADTLKKSRMVEVEIRDENGNNIFPREMELENNRLQFSIEIKGWARGVYSLLVTLAGTETAEMKIVKL